MRKNLVSEVPLNNELFGCCTEPLFFLNLEIEYHNVCDCFQKNFIKFLRWNQTKLTLWLSSLAVVLRKAHLHNRFIKSWPGAWSWVAIKLLYQNFSWSFEFCFKRQEFRFKLESALPYVIVFLIFALLYVSLLLLCGLIVFERTHSCWISIQLLRFEHVPRLWAFKKIHYLLFNMSKLVIRNFLLVREILMINYGKYESIF